MMSNFSFNTIKDFDKHIDLSIPGYSNLVSHILRISSYFLRDDLRMYDFGCSTGNLILALKEANDVNVQYIGVDNSPNMASKNSFILDDDLINFVPNPHIFSTLIFTLQFIQKEDRLNILKAIYKSLQPGGALIIAEKLFINNGFLQDVFSFTYYDFKIINFTPEEILKKQRDLRYIMTPNSEEENMELFRSAGFTKIESFWQSLQFKSWILLK